MVVNGKTESPEKVDEDESADEAEEPTAAKGTSSKGTTNIYRRREEEEEEVQEEENCSSRGSNQTNLPTTNGTLKTLSLCTIPHRGDPRIYR